jgi:alpha-amylase
MLAYPYGTAQVMSSYAFDDSDQGPPTYSDGTTRPIYRDGEPACFGEWICEHRWTAIANMVAFRNVTQSVFEPTDWWSNGANQIAFGRGELGFVVINGEAETQTQTFQTQLPTGRYCNVIQGNPTADGHACQGWGEPITVNAQGQFTASVGSNSALAIHVGARLKEESGF